MTGADIAKNNQTINHDKCVEDDSTRDVDKTLPLLVPTFRWNVVRYRGISSMPSALEDAVSSKDT